MEDSIKQDRAILDRIKAVQEMAKYKYEHQFQADLMLWFDRTFFLLRNCLFCVNNNSDGGVAGNKNKSLGVKRGVSDLIFIGFCFTVYIELKLPGKKQSEDQKEFEKTVKSRGHMYYVVDTMHDAKILINNLSKME